MISSSPEMSSTAHLAQGRTETLYRVKRRMNLRLALLLHKLLCRRGVPVAWFNTNMLTRAVLVFASERKNNVDPRLRSQKKVKNVQLFFAK